MSAHDIDPQLDRALDAARLSALRQRLRVMA